ncbi:deoxyribodipyrimidine photo-lyase [Cereibacter changlensis]|uniref:Deoxyribodipyrimidine photo-lyase n=3 Tax=Cereibacter changlensis TaxID=402884 RepID=A0A2W7QK60_9RHOB|nr:deoxyribodipyrimidine photo-lyase [Cereibacter changlensis]PZX48814.1 deoxyribodipyrimidine photo-lyase [Cereibacter changlensis]
MPDQPLLLWFRRDLRLADHPMLAAALDSGRPLLPVFILDPETEAIGAAAKWRLGEGIATFARALEALGSRLVLRRGPALEVLQALARETGAEGVRWSRLYDPASVARDRQVKAALRAGGLSAESHAGHLLHEPWEVQTGQGGFYKVYTPYWNAVRQRPVADALPAAKRLPAPAQWPESDRLEDWRMGASMQRGAAVVARYASVGEAAAQARLRGFLDARLERYAEARDLPGVEATSRLSEHLTYGEITPRAIWHAGMRALHEGVPGAEKFLKEVVWREFSYHLLHHTPQIASENWRNDWQSFAWRGDSDDAERWRRGMTGEPFVDAAMREMFVTGTMHNRARLIAASYLTKHLLTDWRVGQAWFEECLIDWDPASNALGWQWVAGSGPDASPYFRIFNPATQAEKFDPDAAYRHRFIAELARHPGREALDFFEAAPRRWGLSPKAAYPAPMIGLAEGRDRALAAYAARNA